MRMKKIALLFAALLFAMSACAQEGEKSVSIIVPNGAPAFVFAQMMSEGGQFEGYEVACEVVLGAEALQARINDFDLAVMPTNMAANLYNKGTSIQLVSVVVHGTLYLVGRSQISSLESLKGKVVYNIGKGNTPDITFKYLLEQSGIAYNEDENPNEGEVTLKYVQEATQLMPQLISGEIEYAVIGEPQVTQALENTKNSENPIQVIFDIQQKWEEMTGKPYPQAALVGKKDFLDKNPGLVEKILQKIDGAADWLKESEQNRQAAKEAIAEKGGAISLLAEQTVDRSNIRPVRAEDAKAALEEYYNVLLQVNGGAPIGGKLPDSGFYYKAD